MPLNLSANDGEFTPYIKYNAKAGRFYIRPQGATEDVEIDRPRLAFDMANIKTGWLYYAEGSGPEKVWDPSPQQMAPRPPGPKKFKRGFEVAVFGNDDLRGVGKLGPREFSSTANNVIVAIVNMYAEYEAGVVNNPGCVPFYACTGVKAIGGAYGTNYEPQFVLKAWINREKIPAFDEAADKAEPSNGYTNGQTRAGPPQSSDDFHNQYPSRVPAGRPAQTGGGGRHDDMDDEIPF